jgi:hypothetical protein
MSRLANRTAVASAVASDGNPARQYRHNRGASHLAFRDLDRTTAPGPNNGVRNAPCTRTE